MFAYSNLAVLSVSFVVILSLALSGVALCSVVHLVGGKWHLEIKRLALSLYALFPLAFVLLVVILLNGSSFFSWWDHPVGHEAHMPAWYQPHWFIAREVIGMLFMMALYWVFIKRQDAKDNSAQAAASYHKVATVIPFFFVLYSTMIAWDFEMTLVPAWHSAIYALQQFVSNFANVPGLYGDLGVGLECSPKPDSSSCSLCLQLYRSDAAGLHVAVDLHLLRSIHDDLVWQHS